MSSSLPSSEGRVVHLLEHWGDAVPPVGLRLKPKLAVGGRAALVLLLSVAAAIGVFLVVILWTTDTPGWWFSLLFTVMIGGLLAGLWYAFVEALRSGARREAASARWAETLGAVQLSSGVIVARDVGTGEDGTVTRFDLTIRTEHGATVTGEWRPLSSSRSLLQPQVPGVGGRARVWCVDVASDADPIVIEVLDPTVVVDASGPPEH